MITVDIADKNTAVGQKYIRRSRIMVFPFGKAQQQEIANARQGRDANVLQLRLKPLEPFVVVAPRLVDMALVLHGGQASGKRWGSDVERATSVSFSHLTLPTICSV